MSLPSTKVVTLLMGLVLALQLPISTLFLHGRIQLGVLVSQLIGLALPIVLLTSWQRYDWRRLFPRHWPGAWTLACTIIMTLGIAVASDMVVHWIDTTWSLQPTYREQLVFLISGRPLWENVALFCLLPAVVEESCFRGFCQTSLAHHLEPWKATVITALFFAIMHPQLPYLPIYFLLGLYLGGLYQWKQSLWLPVTAHFVNNVWTLFRFWN